MHGTHRLGPGAERTYPGGTFQPLGMVAFLDPSGPISCAHRGRIDFWSVDSTATPRISTSRDLPDTLQHNNFGETITETDWDPPRPLSIAARLVWDRHVKRIHAEGHWSQQVDHDLLCLFAETTEPYLRFKQDIDDHGTSVQGRTLQEKVRNPSLRGLSQARADLIRLATST